MKFTRDIFTSALCLLAACAAELNPAPEAQQADGPLETSVEMGAGAGEPESEAEQAHARSIVRVHASAIACAVEPGRCQPLTVPITADFTAIFGPDELSRNTARPISDTSCVYEQVLEAPADIWATFGYQAVCLGENDARVCGAHTTRLCSIDLLLQWAERRGESITTRDAILGFEYVVAPQTEPARAALRHAAQMEVIQLLEETTAILREYQAGTRDCPDEDIQEIADANDEGLAIYRQLTGLRGSDSWLPLP